MPLPVPTTTLHQRNSNRPSTYNATASVDTRKTNDNKVASEGDSALDPSNRVNSDGISSKNGCDVSKAGFKAQNRAHARNISQQRKDSPLSGPSITSSRSSSTSAKDRAPLSASMNVLNDDTRAHNRGASLGEHLSSTSKKLPNRTASLGRKAGASKDVQTTPRSSSSTASKPMGPPSSFRTPTASSRSRSSSTNASAATAPQPSRRASSQSRISSSISASTTSTPTARRTSTASTNASSRPAFTTHKPSTPSRTAPAPIPTYPCHPSQIELLQLTHLHRSAAPTLKSYKTSARKSLHRRFLDLQDVYRELLILARQERQAKNLLCLHAWCDGNMASLVRKLSALVEVVAEVAGLTAEESSCTFTSTNNNDDTIANAPSDEPSQIGLYTSVIRRCELWMLWVLEVWDTRDASEIARLGENASPSSTTTAAGTASSNTNASPSFTPISGLGDATKADIKTLTTSLNRLSLRIKDISSPAPPALSFPPPSQTRANPNPNATEEEEQNPTPTTLTRLTSSLLSGMQEELQLMREMEFEVVVGERAWVRGRVGALDVDADDAASGSPWSGLR